MDKYTKKTRSVMDIVISVSCILGGIALMLLKSNSMLILGTFVLLVGMILLLVQKSDYLIGNHEGRYKRATFDFPKTDKDVVTAFMQGHAARLPEGGTGGLLLYIYYKRDRSGGFARLYEYDQGEYQPISELLTLSEWQLAQAL